MTDERDFLKVYRNVVEGQVSFGDGAKRRVLREETLNIDGLSRLKSVIHVEGLKANLISISQLCDQNLQSV